MLILELAFTADATPERLAARPAHRQRLTRLHAEGRLVAAGPFADDSGAVLIFDVDRPGLEEIMAADPYYGTPGVRVHGVREWTPLVGPARGA
ncbi:MULTISPECIES: YciI family protein [Streptomyces]|nr:YciI family protein [Streptomyces alboflavus]